MKKLDVKWTASKNPEDVSFAKDLQAMVDKINELVEEVEALKSKEFEFLSQEWYPHKNKG